MSTPKKQPKADTLPTNDEMAALIRAKINVGTPAVFRGGLFYSPREVCSRLGISESTLRAWRSRFGIPYLRIGARVRFSGRDLTDFLSAMEQTDFEKH